MDAIRALEHAHSIASMLTKRGAALTHIPIVHKADIQRIKTPEVLIERFHVQVEQWDISWFNQRIQIPQIQCKEWNIHVKHLQNKETLLYSSEEKHDIRVNKDQLLKAIKHCQAIAPGLHDPKWTLAAILTHTSDEAFDSVSKIIYEISDV
jgi:hypothetical protein